MRLLQRRAEEQYYDPVLIRRRLTTSPRRSRPGRSPSSRPPNRRRSCSGGCCTHPEGESDDRSFAPMGALTRVPGRAGPVGQPRRPSRPDPGQGHRGGRRHQGQPARHRAAHHPDPAAGRVGRPGQGNGHRLVGTRPVSVLPRTQRRTGGRPRAGRRWRAGGEPADARPTRRAPADPGTRPQADPGTRPQADPGTRPQADPGTRPQADRRGGAPVTGTAVYLYAVTRGPDRPVPAGLTGVSGTPVRTVEHAGLTAVVSSVPLAEYGADALRDNLEDLVWLERTARAHHAVVMAVAQVAATAPVRLTTIFHDGRRVAGLLDDRGD